MHALRVIVLASALALAGLFAGLLQPAEQLAVSGAFMIRDVQLFDGERFVQEQDVHVRAGRINAIGSDLSVPADTPVIDGRGRTLLPGLIDAHVHSYGAARADALRFGVTTMIDMFSDPRGLRASRADREQGDDARQADLWSAGMLATAAGGHGTQFGVEVEPVANPAQASAWVAARRREGSDFIKLVREDLAVYTDEHSLPSLDVATAAAVIAAAHQQGLRAVVHASAIEAARESLRDGADGLVHVFQDQVADAAVVALARERGAFVVPTLTVIASFAGVPADLLADQRAARWLSPAQRDSLAAALSFGAARGESLLHNAEASVAALHRGGVRILAGSDAPNPGTAYGVSLHDEIARLAAAGLGTTAALVAATSAPADAFGIVDRGRIRAGLRADLVLVAGDPLLDIQSTRAILAIWKRGEAVRRDPGDGSTASLASGMAGDFEADDGGGIGTRWTATSDRMAGGRSRADIGRISGGALASAGALRAHGEVIGDGQQVWAGALFSPGTQPMQAVDGRGLKELRFSVRGDGRELAVLLFSGESGVGPKMFRLGTEAEWREIIVPLDRFDGADLARLRGLAFTVNAPAGEFWFELDQIEFR